MFVCLSIPPALNSHVKGEDGAGLYLPPCAGNERKKRDTSQSDSAASEMSCQDGKCPQVLGCLYQAVMQATRGVSAL